jgi:hypothetical protein
MQLPTVLVHEPKRGVFLLTAHVVVGRSVVATGLAATRILADAHGRLAVHAQSLGVAPLPARPILGLDVGKEGVRFRNFFWGLALTTGRSR